MSDNTNPPQGGPHNPYGAPQGPHAGPQGQPGYGGPQGQPGSGGPQSQPGSGGPQGQPGYGGPQSQPGSGGPQSQPGYGGSQGQPGYGSAQGQPGYGGSQGQSGPQYGQVPGQGNPGALWPQPGAADYPQGPQYGQGGQPQYGQAQYGQGGQPPFGGQPQVQQWQPEPRKKRTKLVPLIAVLAVLAVIGGGGIFAYAKLNGGDQPASVLPANSVAYARIDLNPSAGQRVAALRFLMKFPSAKEKIGLTSDKDDLRQKLFDLIKKDAGDDLADVDFEKDVKPWLGDRAGVAAVPADDGKAEAVVAVEVKNQGKATKGLDKLFAGDDHAPKRAFAGKYVLLSDEQSVLDSAVAASKGSSLQDNEKFSKDMSALGEQGFASFWADTKGLALAAGKKMTEQQRAALPEGSAAAVLRFDAQYVELKGVVHGDQSLKVGTKDAGDVIGKLPDTTAGALALSDGANLVGTIWTQLEKSSGQAGINLGDLTKNFTDEYGIALPDDLKPLLGKNLALAIDKDKADGPKIAARMETDPGKAEEVVDKLLNLMHSRTTANVPVKKAKDDDTLVIATDQGYAEQVLKGGNLGQTENFKQAVPDTKGAVLVGYVDFEAIGSLSSKVSSDKDYAALRSAGFSTRVTGDGEADFTLRVVAK
ncbi:flagellar basal body-associated protein FliL [Kribbella voronezhensis]|uniref:Flagellar basal body-associated protein FliL n=1 Tax=Kribbella voronezhensis TaxID=2512212 RepID=A0A4R7T760_9ACTN|nr:DUF3352 domain-containing protein [Kribbella voronezhensis]TDU86937.1 flagellar basal body-associated protein FliL [Kribbella voronezhensis]